MDKRNDSINPARGAKPSAFAKMLMGGLLIVMPVVAYLPAMDGQFVWDDVPNVQKNNAVTAAAGLRRIWFERDATMQYYPLSYSSFWLNYQIWGQQTRGYHVLNVLLHGAVAVLLWRVLLLLGVPGAWVAAAIFALHPVHVDSVAWITERKNVLSGVFYLAAAIGYLRGEGFDHGERVGDFRWGWYAAALVLFVCALLSKTATCALPAVLLVVLWWKRGSLKWADALKLAPFFAVGLALALVTIGVEKRQGAVGADWGMPIVSRFVLAGRTLCFYAGKLLWPADLVFIYPRWKIDSGQWWQYLYGTSALALMLALWFLRSRLGRGALAAVLVFAGTLVPVLGFFDVYFHRFSFVADHFQYLASMSLIALVVGLVVACLRRVGHFGVALGAACLVIVLGAMGSAAWQHSKSYQTAEALWTTTLATNPDAWIAHNNLGIILKQKKQVDQAISHYEKAIRLNPKYAQAHYNLSIAMADRGDIEDAIAHYGQAIEIKESYVEARTNLAALLQTQGRLDEALYEYEIIALNEPQSSIVQFNLGFIYQKLGRHDDASLAYKRSIALDPDYEPAQVALDALKRQSEFR